MHKNFHVNYLLYIIVPILIVFCFSIRPARADDELLATLHGKWLIDMQSSSFMSGNVDRRKAYEKIVGNLRAEFDSINQTYSMSLDQVSEFGEFVLTKNNGDYFVPDEIIDQNIFLMTIPGGSKLRFYVIDSNTIAWYPDPTEVAVYCVLKKVMPE